MSYKDNTLIHTIFVRCEISSDFFLINGIDNVYDRIQISDIESFYKERICELETELYEIERPAIDMEEYLLMKFKAELGYCQKARIKTGLGAVKEIVGIIGNIDDAIENYEMSERLTFTMKS